MLKYQSIKANISRCGGMVDTADLKSSDACVVPVRVRPPAPYRAVSPWGDGSFDIFSDAFRTAALYFWRGILKLAAANLITAMRLPLSVGLLCASAFSAPPQALRYCRSCTSFGRGTDNDHFIHFTIHRRRFGAGVFLLSGGISCT